MLRYENISLKIPVNVLALQAQHCRLLFTVIPTVLVVFLVSEGPSRQLCLRTQALLSLRSP